MLFLKITVCRKEVSDGVTTRKQAGFDCRKG